MGWLEDQVANFRGAPLGVAPGFYSGLDWTVTIGKGSMHAVEIVRFHEFAHALLDDFTVWGSLRRRSSGTRAGPVEPRDPIKSRTALHKFLNNASSVSHEVYATYLSLNLSGHHEAWLEKYSAYRQYWNIACGLVPEGLSRPAASIVVDEWICACMNVQIPELMALEDGTTLEALPPMSPKEMPDSRLDLLSGRAAEIWRIALPRMTDLFSLKKTEDFLASSWTGGDDREAEAAFRAWSYDLAASALRASGRSTTGPHDEQGAVFASGSSASSAAQQFRSSLAAPLRTRPCSNPVDAILSREHLQLRERPLLARVSPFKLGTVPRASSPTNRTSIRVQSRESWIRQYSFAPNTEWIDSQTDAVPAVLTRSQLDEVSMTFVSADVDHDGGNSFGEHTTTFLSAHSWMRTREGAGARQTSSLLRRTATLIVVDVPPVSLITNLSARRRIPSVEYSRIEFFGSGRVIKALIIDRELSGVGAPLLIPSTLSGCQLVLDAWEELGQCRPLKNREVSRRYRYLLTAYREWVVESEAYLSFWGSSLGDSQEVHTPHRGNA